MGCGGSKDNVGSQKAASKPSAVPSSIASDFPGLIVASSKFAQDYKVEDKKV
jgi:hypothetical protein